MSWRASLWAVVIAGVLGACGGGGGGGSDEPSGGTAEPLSASSPELVQWNADLLTYGALHCNREVIQSQQLWEGGVWYYDGAKVYYQTRDFTADASWDRCAEDVLEVYRRYVLTSGGAVPGWRVFPHGLYENYRRSGDEGSREAVLLLARKSAFAASGGSADPELSRETAYILHAYLFAEKLGAAAEFDLLRAAAVEHSLSHLDAWSSGRTPYVKPFMVALTAEALIHDYQERADARIPEAIGRAADLLWRTCWRADAGSFVYINCTPGALNEECRTSQGNAPDLNLLIAPVYAWLYSQNGDGAQGARADAVFAGGVRGADLTIGKHFSQNYRWSFDAVRWRYGVTRQSEMSM